MAQREILNYPKHTKALRSKSEAVRSFDKGISNLIEDLMDTLAAHPEGIGLAAPQINVHKRVVIVRLGIRDHPVEERQAPLALVNPVICRAGEERRDFDGCLSFPGLYGETVRPHFLCVSWLDETGTPHKRDFTGLNAVLVHHEIDHLEGVLFIDRIERADDLFRIGEDEFGQTVRMPVSLNPPEKSPSIIERPIPET